MEYELPILFFQYIVKQNTKYHENIFQPDEILSKRITTAIAELCHRPQHAWQWSQLSEMKSLKNW